MGAQSRPARHLFVVGPGRSGTSLTRNLLSLHPAVAIAPETHFLDQWLPRYWARRHRPDWLTELWREYRQSSHFAALGLPEDVAEAIPTLSPRQLFTRLLHEYAVQQGAHVAGEKTAAHFRHVKTLLEWFPDGQVIFVIRDSRAMVASMKALDAPWASGPLTEHVLLWRAAADAALQWRRHPRVHILRYESLVRDPVESLAEIFARIDGSGFDSKWLTERAGKTDQLSNGSLLASGEVTDRRIDSWRGRLTPSEARLVMHATSPQMAQLGYNATSKTPYVTPVWALRLAWHQARRLRRSLGSPVGSVARYRYRREMQRP